jgi:hypothetical protein
LKFKGRGNCPTEKQTKDINGKSTNKILSE